MRPMKEILKLKEKEIIENTTGEYVARVICEAHEIEKVLFERITTMQIKSQSPADMYDDAVSVAPGVALYSAMCNILYNAPKWVQTECMPTMAYLHDYVYTCTNPLIKKAVADDYKKYIKKGNHLVEQRRTDCCDNYTPSNLNMWYSYSDDYKRVYCQVNNINTVDGGYYDGSMNMANSMFVKNGIAHMISNVTTATKIDRRRNTMKAAIETYDAMSKLNDAVSFAFDIIWYSLKEDGVVIDGLEAVNIGAEEYKECLDLLNSMPIMKSYIWSCVYEISTRMIFGGVSECQKLHDENCTRVHVSVNISPSAEKEYEKFKSEDLNAFLRNTIEYTARNIDRSDVIHSKHAINVIAAECICSVMGMMDPNDAACFNGTLYKILSNENVINEIDNLIQDMPLNYTMKEMVDIFETSSFYSSSKRFDAVANDIFDAYCVN